MPRKYRNVPTVIDGIRFDSKKEAKRWGELRLLKKAGEIDDLSRQLTYNISVQGILICKYTADFDYFDCKKQKIIVEDVKSPATRKNPVYRIKKKLMKAIHGIEIQEI